MVVIFAKKAGKKLFPKEIILKKGKNLGLGQNTKQLKLCIKCGVFHK
jgi:hypothetical protein